MQVESNSPEGEKQLREIKSYRLNRVAAEAVFPSPSNDAQSNTGAPPDDAFQRIHSCAEPFPNPEPAKELFQDGR
jgi:hypothetical protein